MPTAVERLLDSFLKFDGLREQDTLNDAFLKIDDTFLKLSNVNADNFLKIEHDRSVTIKGGGFEVIGDAFIKLGGDFHKISIAGQLIDEFAEIERRSDDRLGGYSARAADGFRRARSQDRRHLDRPTSRFSASIFSRYTRRRRPTRSS